MNPNRQAIIAGLFVAAGTVLLLAGFLFFGGRSIFTPKATFVTFFNESVKGLEVGSTVRFKGVPIGKVTSIRIQMSGDTTISGIPVFYEIDRRRLSEDLGVIEDIQSDEVYHASLRNGLSASLEAESLVTGILAISVDFRPELALDSLENVRLEIFEIPAAPSTLSSIQGQVATIVDQFAQIDFLRLANSTTALIEEVRLKVGDINTGDISDEALALLSEARSLVESADFREALAELQALIANVNQLSGNLDQEITRLGPDLVEMIDDFGKAIDALNTLVGNANEVVDPDSLIYRNTKRMLRELEITLRAIRQLAIFLEANPNAILSGRSE